MEKFTTLAGAAAPLTRANIERIFIPIIADLNKAQNTTRLGRDIALSGARGGVGTSTIATNLAWYISSELHRHTASERVPDDRRPLDAER